MVLLTVKHVNIVIYRCTKCDVSGPRGRAVKSAVSNHSIISQIAITVMKICKSFNDLRIDLVKQI